MTEKEQKLFDALTELLDAIELNGALEEAMENADRLLEELR